MTCQWRLVRDGRVIAQGTDPADAAAWQKISRHLNRAGFTYQQTDPLLAAVGAYVTSGPRATEAVA